jgi:hypothetical protein
LTTGGTRTSGWRPAEDTRCEVMARGDRSTKLEVRPAPGLREPCLRDARAAAGDSTGTPLLVEPARLADSPRRRSPRSASSIGDSHAHPVGEARMGCSGPRKSPASQTRPPRSSSARRSAGPRPDEQQWAIDSFQGVSRPVATDRVRPASPADDESPIPRSRAKRFSPTPSRRAHPCRCGFRGRTEPAADALLSARPHRCRPVRADARCPLLRYPKECSRRSRRVAPGRPQVHARARARQAPRSSSPMKAARSSGWSTAN